MKTTLRMRAPLAGASSPLETTPVTPDDDRAAKAAFYFLMGTLLLALVVFILLPFIN